MANEEQVELLRQGVEGWNRWLWENWGVKLDLRGADLSGVDLSGAALSRADLSRAVLHRANLSRADLRGADLSQADLRGANLSRANLSRANLSRADLSEVDLSQTGLSQTGLSQADLSQADLSQTGLSQTGLSQADLSRADLSRASMLGTTFGDIDLSEVKGLETIRHWGPSTLGIDTLYRSKGKIPEVFLRGCGLSDLQILMALLHHPDLTSEQITDITYKIHELRVGKSIRYYSCFISYSHQDEDFARRLHDGLQDSGVRCWYAPEDMKIGDKIRSRIDASIRVHDKLLLVLSAHSINSRWVEKEVETAFEEEDRRKQTVLFPVRLDPTVMETNQAWAADIRRTRHIGDFCRWKDHDAYQQAFHRLIRDLKAEEK